jgi:type IV secretory pathway VirB2 component (pilin)
MANMIGILTGGTARFLAAIMFIGGALMWGFSRNEDGMQTIAKVIMAAGLIIGCLTLTDFLFGAVV